MCQIFPNASSPSSGETDLSHWQHRSPCSVFGAGAVGTGVGATVGIAAVFSGVPDGADDGGDGAEGTAEERDAAIAELFAEAGRAGVALVPFFPRRMTFQPTGTSSGGSKASPKD